MVEGVAPQVQREDRVHPGRLDAPPAPVGLLAPDDPGFRLAQRRLAHGPAQRLPVGEPVVLVEDPVEEHESAGPVPQRRSGAVWSLAGPQLVDAERDRPDRAVGAHDGDGDGGLARPAAEVVDVAGHPRRERHDLWWEGRQLVPGPEPEQREPDPREDPRVLDPARGADERRGPRHVLVGRLVAGEAERAVRLDRRRQVPRPAVVRGPGPVGTLLRADPRRGLRRVGRLTDAEELTEQQVLGVHRHVRLELALPPTLGFLDRKEVGARFCEGVARRGELSLLDHLGGCHA